MLRRRPDNTFEFREIERVLYSIQPPALAPERKDALRARIMSSLGEQDALRAAGILTPAFRERWVTVPVGASLAAAIIAGIYVYAQTTEGDGGEADVAFVGQLSLDGSPVDELRPGLEFIALSHTNVTLGKGVALLLEQGASFSYLEAEGQVTVHPVAGSSTVATGDTPANVVGAGWTARLGVNSIARFTVSRESVTVESEGGLVSLTDVEGITHALIAGKPVTFSLGGPASPDDLPPMNLPGGAGNTQPPFGPQAPAATDSNDGDVPADSLPPATPGNPEPPVVPPAESEAKPPKSTPPPAVEDPGQPEESSEPQDPPADVPPADPPADTPGDPPADPPGPTEETPPTVPPGQGGDIPADPPGQGEPGEPGGPADGPPAGPPENPGEQGNGNGPGSNNGNGNAFGPDGNAGQGQGKNNLVLASVAAPEQEPAVSAQSAGSDDDRGVVPLREPGTGNTNKVDEEHPGTGNGNAFGPSNGQGNGPGANNGNAETNPGKGQGPNK